MSRRGVLSDKYTLEHCRNLIPQPSGLPSGLPSSVNLFSGKKMKYPRFPAGKRRDLEPAAQEVISITRQEKNLSQESTLRPASPVAASPLASPVPFPDPNLPTGFEAPAFQPYKFPAIFPGNELYAEHPPLTPADPPLTPPNLSTLSQEELTKTADDVVAGIEQLTTPDTTQRKPLSEIMGTKSFEELSLTPAYDKFKDITDEEDMRYNMNVMADAVKHKTLSKEIMDDTIMSYAQEYPEWFYD